MGWSYEDWRGPFYPAGMAMSRALEEYAKIFDTVELDTTFYGTPRPSTLDGWATQVPPDFLFSAKVPRAVTHERRLIGATEAALDFAGLLHAKLGARLGALLLQLPPDFSPAERGALDAFADGVTDPRRAVPGAPWVVEFRHAAWAETNVAATLAARGIACATTERLDVGAPLRYVRLLGEDNSIKRFDERIVDRGADLAVWAGRIEVTLADADPGAPPPPLLVYARNFFEGHAPATLLDLRARLALPVPTPPGKQQMSLF
jgi:uncharacterized protein YecE (DUF72 family)